MATVQFSPYSTKVLNMVMSILYHPFMLKCFEEFRKQTLEYMNQFDGENIYVKEVPITSELIESFKQEMIDYGLPGAWNFLSFKRKNFLSESMNSTHVDYSRHFSSPVHTSLVIPVEGCKDTHMYWMDGNYQLNQVATSTNSKEQNVAYGKIQWNESPTVVDKVEINDSPMLAKASIPHSVTSRTDGSYRTILSVRFIGNPTFEEVLEKYLKK
jgi:hypothetical protein